MVYIFEYCNLVIFRYNFNHEKNNAEINWSEARIDIGISRGTKKVCREIYSGVHETCISLLWMRCFSGKEWQF